MYWIDIHAEVPTVSEAELNGPASGTTSAAVQYRRVDRAL